MIIIELDYAQSSLNTYYSNPSRDQFFIFYHVIEKKKLKYCENLSVYKYNMLTWIK